jgi:hypothetical protein
MDPHDIKSCALHVYEPLQGPMSIRVMILEPALSSEADLHISFEESHRRRDRTTTTRAVVKTATKNAR